MAKKFVLISMDERTYKELQGYTSYTRYNEIGHELAGIVKENGIPLDVDTSSEPTWIPCSKRMPKEYRHTDFEEMCSEGVLMTVCLKNSKKLVDTGYTRNGRWYSFIADAFLPDYAEVLAWMPMPKEWEGEPG